MTIQTENSRLRFVVLFHEFPAEHQRQDHWDLMLEHDGKLLTWSLGESPSPGKSISARHLPEHRIDYLNYEGPVSRDRGSVTRVLEGTYIWRSGFEFQVATLELESASWEIKIFPGEESDCLIEVSELMR